MKVSDVKWIKITTDIFDDEKMYAIETMQDGYLLELIWFKLLCLAGKCNNHGFLMINNKIAYTDEMLSKIFRIEVGSIQRALALFQTLEMIEIVENAYMIANWDKHQSGDRLDVIKEQNRKRQQRHRENQKILALTDSNVTNNVTDNVTNNVNCSISYSYSNSFNTNIYYKLLNSNKYKYIEDNDLLNSEIVAWLEYKESIGKKKGSYTERGLQTLLKQIIGYDKEYGTSKVAAVIDDSISNKYLGICWDKIEKIKVFEDELKKETPKEEAPIDYGWED